MAGAMKARATVKDGIADVRVVMNHPMETGLRKGSDGKFVPQHFIQNITVKLNGRTVVEGQISQAVSRNPVFSFRIKGAKSGDKVQISWLDNKGETNNTEAAVA
ncbi:MAG: thiosulfate oxidation carrier complex protein SoxZ [Betaproteobacteria bacterium]|nr:thiosulfate oxidation carrier complex protein SoxZ [Betaproteobacteria bacterium]